MSILYTKTHWGVDDKKDMKQVVSKFADKYAIPTPTLSRATNPDYKKSKYTTYVNG